MIKDSEIRLIKNAPKKVTISKSLIDGKDKLERTYTPHIDFLNAMQEFNIDVLNLLGYGNAIDNYAEEIGDVTDKEKKQLALIKLADTNVLVTAVEIGVANTTCKITASIESLDSQETVKCVMVDFDSDMYSNSSQLLKKVENLQKEAAFYINDKKSNQLKMELGEPEQEEKAA